MTQMLASWWSGIWASLAVSVAILRGDLNPLAIAGALAAVCLLAGVILAILWREKQAFWMLLLLLLASLAPIVLGAANHIAGWFGAGFAAIAGAVLLLVATALVSNAATRRLPVWLIGIFAGAFAISCGLFGFDFAVLK